MSFVSEFIHFTHSIPMGSLRHRVAVQTLVETGLMGLTASIFATRDWLEWIIFAKSF